MGEAQLRLSTTTWGQLNPLWSPTEATQANRSNTRMKLLASFLLVLLSSSVVSCHVQEQEPTRKLQQTAGNPFPLPLESAFSQLSNILAAAFSRGVQWGYDHPYTSAFSSGA